MKWCVFTGATQEIPKDGVQYFIYWYDEEEDAFDLMNYRFRLKMEAIEMAESLFGQKGDLSVRIYKEERKVGRPFPNMTRVAY